MEETALNEGVRPGFGVKTGFFRTKLPVLVQKTKKPGRFAPVVYFRVRRVGRNRRFRPSTVLSCTDCGAESLIPPRYCTFLYTFRWGSLLG